MRASWRFPSRARPAGRGVIRGPGLGVNFRASARAHAACSHAHPCTRPLQVSLVLQRNSAGASSTGWTLLDIFRAILAAHMAFRADTQPDAVTGLRASPSVRKIAAF